LERAGSREKREGGGGWDAQEEEHSFRFGKKEDEKTTGRRREICVKNTELVWNLREKEQKTAGKRSARFDQGKKDRICLREGIPIDQ